MRTNELPKIGGFQTSSKHTGDSGQCERQGWQLGSELGNVKFILAALRV